MRSHRRTLWAVAVACALVAAAGLAWSQSRSSAGPSGFGERGPGRGGGTKAGGVGWSERPATLRDGLVAYWTLDEVSGTRSDSIGGNHLSDINTVGSDVGVIGNGAVFVAANSEHLLDSTPSLVPTAGGPFTVSLWYKQGAGITGSGTWGVFTGGESGTGWTNTGGALYNSNNGTAVVMIGCSSATRAQYALSATVPWKFPTGDTTNWHHAVFWWTGTTAGWMFDNNGTADAGLVQVYSGFTPPDTCAKTAFTGYGIGLLRGVNVGSPNSFWDGMIDEVGVWNRMLTRAEITALASGVRP